MNEGLYPARVKKDSNSKVIALPRQVREALGIVVGDLVVFRLLGRVAMMKRMVPGEVMPFSVAEARAAADAAAGRS